MSDTPRTNALVQIIEGGHEYCPQDKLLPFARKLEIELARSESMRAWLGDEMAKQREGNGAYILELRNERDALRAINAQLAEALQLAGLYLQGLADSHTFNNPTTRRDLRKVKEALAACTPGLRGQEVWS